LLEARFWRGRRAAFFLSFFFAFLFFLLNQNFQKTPFVLRKIVVCFWDCLWRKLFCTGNPRLGWILPVTKKVAPAASNKLFLYLANLVPKWADFSEKILPFGKVKKG
jgi:hypothetical protein